MAKCIMNKGGGVRRLDNKRARDIVEWGDWKFISKSLYKLLKKGLTK